MSLPTLFSWLVIGFLGITLLSTAQAQELQYARPSWKFGVAAGANLNYFNGSTQQLTSSFTPPTAFHKGDGIGVYVAPSIEYYRPNSYLGFIFQAGFDSRKGNFNQVITPCNCAADLDAKLTYFSVEPSLRLAPFKSNLYVYGGPRLAFNIDKSFTYKQQTNPSYPLQVANPDETGDFTHIEKTILSIQIGMGYDIYLSSQATKTQFILSPFVAFHPYFGQNPRTTETWNLTTLRAGMVLKMGRGKQINPIKWEPKNVVFSIDAPQIERIESRMREVFPLRNYVFFTLGSNEIPTRYVLLNKEQAKKFKEDQVQFSVSKKKSKRSERQMAVYYNLLNILGDRMQKNPLSTIKLVGSSENGIRDGWVMATKVKDYLTTTFEIDSLRITLEGRVKPEHPSEREGGKKELELLREGDQRVTIESTSPELLMEFQSGDAPLRSVEIISSDWIENKDQIIIHAEGAKEAYKNWILELKDSNGKTVNFGPYTKDSIAISRKSVLKDQQQGTFVAVLTGTTKNGEVVKKETTMRIFPLEKAEIIESIRFSVIYEFNESKSIAIYEKYLSEIVVEKIPMNATVLIKGYTDIIGEDDYNQNLSLARATDVKNTIAESLEKRGRTDVKFEIYGYGEDKHFSLFENTYPEERFYNRTVVIDIIAKKGN
jgi:outer membrane protein OmpA-like peptidoglycan-associated protein